ncbi:MAG: ribosome-associated translation inhibitor RaiA [Gemmatimonadetes bacterium]|nr:ribosome-associated translation inhibitor RaiA [Gemmatimonadota bacterium]NIQ58946.1 ribosome-associated translation inhibitor RaiA [Gemmatimonadota bacterium]NIU79136.1 ribosome-associated translation inhibitor RaiA [Gammaproteobacteria bacterium]NIX47841.1 ribosome-associated translation inhibitor RaiA [Gemmatimonadota bacterium]NIY12206.1 ribosome-associated translation inhibitor RaiA [Gemmatimonadota bacterium]
MDVRITTRHVSLSDSFAAHATERAHKLAKYEPRLIAVDLIFEDDHGQFSTEARAEVPGIPTLVARATGTSKRKTLDEAMQKLGRRLRRERSKRVDHQAPPSGAVIGE